MLGNFSYANPTRLYFGEDSLRFLEKELAGYGPVVMLVYGGGSIRKNGIYDSVTDILRRCGKEVVELSGVMPNPTIGKLREGAALGREKQVDLILAVGGGSVIDYAKGVAASVWCDEDPWEKYYTRMEEPDCPVVPVGCVLTMSGTGSEMNGGSVITHPGLNLKVGKVFGEKLMPRFAVLNPVYTFTLPRYQMVAGFFDIMSHLMEQYFSGTDDNTSDYIAEALMRSLVHSSRIAIADPTDYEARSNIMWTATWALNTLIKCGKKQDWMVHMIGQAMGAHTDATHGMTLAVVSLPYYRRVLEAGLPKFRRFAVEVWDVRPEGKTDEEIAREGLSALEAWMREIGLVMRSSELGVREEMLEGIADSTFILDAGFRKLTRAEVVEILRESL